MCQEKGTWYLKGCSRWPNKHGFLKPARRLTCLGYFMNTLGGAAFQMSASAVHIKIFRGSRWLSVIILYIFAYSWVNFYCAILPRIGRIWSNRGLLVGSLFQQIETSFDIREEAPGGTEGLKPSRATWGDKWKNKRQHLGK